MSLVELHGCNAEPLGSYLKALAVLRLVSEQADPDAHGCWGPACFRVECSLDENELTEFFLLRYRPTPILAPWNGGSGFYPKDRKVGIDAIIASTDERFALYRQAATYARSIPAVERGKGSSPAEEEERRTAILLACRNGLPDACVDWLDAAIGISAEGKRAFAPILGTGGNEGRLDYTNSFMEYLSQLLISPGQKAPVGSLLENALFGTATAGFQPSAVGQYDPGRAGGFNQGQGVEAADVPSNPWNFVLTLEGAVAWASGLYRRQGVRYKPFLCSPFTVRSTAVGYGSSTGKDGALSRAEVWAPLWSRPSRYAEVKALLREGRASLDAKPARNGLEFAQAACMLGVDRGIDGFVRYNLLKRRGDSYIALPSGRFEVTERPETALVRELAPILEETDAQLRTPPAGYESLRRQVDEAIYTLLLSGGPQALEDLATSMGRLTRWILGTAKAVRFYKRLSEKWLNSLWHLPEARIASAVAGIWHPDVGAFRNHIDRNAREFAWTGADLPERMTRALERRILLAESLGVKHNALTSAVYAGAGDAVSFLEGTLDDELIEDLVFAFTLLDWRRAGQRRAENENEVGVWPIYALLKHLFLSSALATPAGDVFVTGDLAVTSALRANRIDEAAQTATRRLLNAGLLPIEAEFEAGFDGMRLAASLLIPVRYGAALRSPVLRSAATGA